MRRHIRAATAVLAAVYLCLALSACGGREREKADTDGDTLPVTIPIVVPGAALSVPSDPPS